MLKLCRRQRLEDQKMLAPKGMSDLHSKPVSQGSDNRSDDCENVGELAYLVAPVVFENVLIGFA